MAPSSTKVNTNQEHSLGVVLHTCSPNYLEAGAGRLIESRSSRPAYAIQQDANSEKEIETKDIFDTSLYLISHLSIIKSHGLYAS